MRRPVIVVFVLIAAMLLVCCVAASKPTERMIRGLDDISRITPEEAEHLPEPQGEVQLNMDGERLPYDVQSNTYFIPQDDSEEFVGKLEILRQEGWEYMLCAYADLDKQAAVENSIGYKIYGKRQNECIMSKIIFTGLPVLCITTQSGELPLEEDDAAELKVFTPENGKIQMDLLKINIHMRGNTSKRFPKKSYRVTIVNEQGKKINHSIADLRSDDDWILNPMYTDTSKVREWLAYETWATMNSSGTRAASSRLRHVELFFNDEYWGLYGIQERIDRKQVGGDKNTGVLYKMLANNRPTSEELLNCADPEVCGGIKLSFAGSRIRHPWAAAAGYMALLNGEKDLRTARFHLENIIDYGLWAMLTQAHDCHFKNQFLHGVYENGSHTLYKIPWDLNNTFGDVWNNEAEDTNYTEYYIGKYVYDCIFEKLLEEMDADVREQIRARWLELREDALCLENLLEPAQALHEHLLPAIERDTRRWPKSGMGLGNAADMHDIESYLETVLPDLDAYFESL